MRQGAPFADAHNGGMSQHPTPLPVPSDRILVVAPTDALRASLRFLLEEENYSVTTTASLDEVEGLREAFACSVIDHLAFSARQSVEIEAFMQAHWPSVLLANGAPGMTLPPSFRVVTKPLLGAALAHAVREAVTMGATIQPG